VSSEPGSHGTTAHKQGRSAGEKALGGDREIAGSLGTQVVKIFDQAAARTGLRDHEAALLLNSFEELAATATVRNWLVVDANGSMRELSTSEPARDAIPPTPGDSLACSLHGSTG
jgi:NADPH-dependent 2,4-dienoyl-CoA reductase/sulfur reductase-like enzyme